MKHLRIFNSIQEFEAAKETIDKPFVVLEKENGKILFSNIPTITEDDLTGGEYIDLGLPSGLLWASCNLGASKPCEYGKYFQWGDTVGYTDENNCLWGTAPFNNGSDGHNSEYFEANKSQWLDENENLKSEYDAVSVATDGEAHMPTKADFDELIDNNNTTREWCTCSVLGDDHKEHNVYGSLFTSKVNGNKIFIPAKGGSYLWSSSLHMTDSNNSSAAGLGLSSGKCYTGRFGRVNKHTIRGVKSSN